MGGSGPVAPRCLGELPERRREMLLWTAALLLDYDGVEDDVLHRAQRECAWRYYPAGTQHLLARRGSDGRYHLCVGERVVCGEHIERRRRGEASGVVRHEQWCYWWTDGVRYRLQPPAGEPFLAHEQRPFPTVRWSFRLTGDTAAPDTVPPRRRCPTHGARALWPAHLNPATTRGRLRLRLATEFGHLCHACGRIPAAVIDHDHVTNLVRGLLCRNCNQRVETCPHLAGCPWADYLNAPPAAALQLPFPAGARRRISAGHAQRVLSLGFDIYD